MCISTHVLTLIRNKYNQFIVLPKNQEFGIIIRGTTEKLKGLEKFFFKHSGNNIFVWTVCSNVHFDSRANCYRNKYNQFIVLPKNQEFGIIIRGTTEKLKGLEKFFFKHSGNNILCGRYAAMCISTRVLTVIRNKYNQFIVLPKNQEFGIIIRGTTEKLKGLEKFFFKHSGNNILCGQYAAMCISTHVLTLIRNKNNQFIVLPKNQEFGIIIRGQLKKLKGLEKFFFKHSGNNIFVWTVCSNVHFDSRANSYQK
ncbi:hypothetical protein CEXT_251561 [Caerostris extrusa]|uniref:Uncharacterized protein n=1 Tax=Caerostris extrusa TaxID=172846 RepID=A0AAV4NGK6_CAEEX|nr:hypothetical protein CEXT_251561 [Caerostris extrusa]